jgi:hypothetical protein
VPLAKRIGCGILGSIGSCLGAVPLLMLVEKHILGASGGPLLGFICLALLVGGGVFGATWLARSSGRTIGIFAGVCFAMLVVFSPFAASGSKKNTADFYDKDKAKDYPPPPKVETKADK